MAHFEVVSKYKDSPIELIPKRATQYSAGYDMVAAEDIIIPSYRNLFNKMYDNYITGPIALDDVATMVKKLGVKPTLVPTGVKCYMGSDQYLQLQVRSSLPLKHWLICANGIGIIDADYADNESNEGLIYIQLINLSPWDISISAGSAIAQGIILNYNKVEDDSTTATRKGGLGSTSA